MIQTVDLKTAQKMKVYLQVGTKSPFFWHEYDYAGYSNEDAETEPCADLHYLRDLSWDPIKDGEIEITHHTRNNKIWYTPTLCEMLELLPDYVIDHLNNDVYGRVLTPRGIHYFRDGECLDKSKSFDGFQHSGKDMDNPATAAAKLYMWLCDQGYIRRYQKYDKIGI